MDLDDVLDVHVVGWVHDLMVSLLLPYLENLFDYVAYPMGIVLKTVALVAVLFIAVNQVLQFKHVNFSEYLLWGIRYILIASFAFVWGNFEAIYRVITETPHDYGALMTQSVLVNYAVHRKDMLDPTRINDAYDALDAIGGTLFWMAEDFFADTAWNDLPMSIKNIGLGILFGIIGAIWIAVCAIITLIADIGLIMALGLAPLAICMLMMEQTKQYFEAWSRFVLSFLIIPLLLAALSSILLYAACEILLVTKAGSEAKETYLIFAVIVIASFVLLWRLPEMGQAISGSAIGAAGTSLARSIPGRGRSAASTVRSVGRRVRDGAQVANAANKAGASPGRILWATISGMRQSAIARQNRRDDRLAGRTKGSAGNDSGKAPRRKNSRGYNMDDYNG
ncbi:type IV secretion system protein [Ensifer sp. YR511]|uniref:type IV secretion system protein n=1 Tax=Ensifer sp. YR511 TaxID=1855294 RepID=UPI000891F446|nr:type IV secretion system protein [Ensifer sp. YR511]SDO11247.1 type IV secretion system protein VirB6 [Ensifer sp. YR511]